IWHFTSPANRCAAARVHFLMSDESQPPEAPGCSVPESPLTRKPVNRTRLWGFCALLAIAAAWFGASWLWTSPPHLPRGVTSEEYVRAAANWKRRYHRTPDERDVMSWLAESAVAQGDLEKAADCFEQIPSTHPVYGRSARHQQGQVLQKLNRLCAAEQS